jgi:RNA polymerase sigma factor (sigma-70 family)
VPSAAVDPERANAATALLEAHGPVLRRIARRHSTCVEDADDAFQRAAEILLTKAPVIGPGRLIAWMAVVTKHEAMAVRRGRERLLGALAPPPIAAVSGDPLDTIASEHPGPAERVERLEHLAEGRAALGALKADQRVAILLQAHGYSYAEICEICQWTYTKVNRCLAEGRARLRERRRDAA